MAASDAVQISASHHTYMWLGELYEHDGSCTISNCHPYRVYTAPLYRQRGWPVHGEREED